LVLHDYAVTRRFLTITTITMSATALTVTAAIMIIASNGGLAGVSGVTGVIGDFKAIGVVATNAGNIVGDGVVGDGARGRGVDDPPVDLGNVVCVDQDVGDEF